jgi:hypothetical protein
MHVRRRAARLAAVGVIGAAGVVGFAPSADASTFLAGIYPYSNHGGTPQNFTVPENGYMCTGTTSDVDLDVNYPAGITWFMNDNTTSFVTSANCWVKLFENSNWSGRTYGYSGTTYQVPSDMNNRASALYIS